MDHIWLQEKGPTVPEISNERLDELLAKFSPLIIRNGKYFKIAKCDPRRTAFTWDPALLEEVAFVPSLAVSTDHTCGYHAFFKPSLAEVLAQIPDVVPEEANAFCIDLDQTIGIYQSGTGHRATTQFGIAKEIS